MVRGVCPTTAGIRALCGKVQGSGAWCIGVHSVRGDDAVGTVLQDKNISSRRGDKETPRARYAVASWPTYY